MTKGENKMKTKQTIFELKNSMDPYIDPIDYDIMYSERMFSYNDLLKTITASLSVSNAEALELELTVKIIEAEGLQDFIEYWELEAEQLIGYKDNTAFIKDYFNEALDYINYNFAMYDRDDSFINDILEGYNFTITTVGYSQWAYVICPLDSVSFAKDLWEGWNFYDISQYEVLDDGELDHIDSISGVYFEYGADIMEYIQECFNFDTENYGFILNNDSEHLTKNFRTYNKHRTITNYIKEVGI